MIGVVLVTHGRLAEEFISALEHVVGKQSQMVAICIESDDDMEDCRLKILAATQGVDSGDGVILLTDMFGGTPSNLAISIMEQANVEVVAGINLPMLIKLATSRDGGGIAEVAVCAQEAGRKYINIASTLLAGRGFS